MFTITAIGTVSPGGTIFTIDLDGRHVLLLEPDGLLRQLGGEFKVRDGYLHYKILESDENNISFNSIDAKIPLPAWPPIE